MPQQLKLTRRHKEFLTGMATGNQRDAPEVLKQLEAAGAMRGPSWRMSMTES